MKQTGSVNGAGHFLYRFQCVQGWVGVGVGGSLYQLSIGKRLGTGQVISPSLWTDGLMTDD